MSAVVMDGKALAAEIKQALRKRCAALSRPPRLAVVLVGDDPASAVYVRNKEQDCAQCGISCADHRLPSGTSQAELLELIDTLNRDEAVDGILVQMPLPAHLDAGQVLRAIDPAKDVDAFHPENVGLLHLGQPRYLPCTRRDPGPLKSTALTRRASTAWWWAAAISWAGPWLRFCCRRMPPSPSATARPPTCAPNACRRIS